MWQRGEGGRRGKGSCVITLWYHIIFKQKKILSSNNKNNKQIYFCSRGLRDIREPTLFSCTTQTLPLHSSVSSFLVRESVLVWQNSQREEAAWILVTLHHRFIFSLIFSLFANESLHTSIKPPSLMFIL